MKHKLPIALACDVNGDWNTAGWGNIKEYPERPDDLMGTAVETLCEGERRYWVEVEVEFPERPDAETVQGKATEVEQL